MQTVMNFFDQSKQLNLKTSRTAQLPYHGPQGRFKIIHQGLMIPNLPAPLHYLNFLSIIGQPNAPMLKNTSAIQTHALDTATVISSVSGKMLTPLQSYSIATQCDFKPNQFKFGQRETVTGQFPKFIVERDDPELSYQIEVKTTNTVSHFTKLKLGVFDHWSILSHCAGDIYFQGQHYQIDQLGAFEYARAIHLPYLPLSFFTYQIINLDDKQQLLLAQIRNQFNQIVQSRIYLRHLDKGAVMYDEDVHFRVHRVYPMVVTPNRQQMYLPREMSWSLERNGQKIIQVQAKCRGDFKFGLAAGYVGSYEYEVYLDGQIYYGKSGYCEYIDCRKLNWQEIDENEQNYKNILKSNICLASENVGDEIKNT